MTRIKEYQTNRNAYTKQSFPAVGKTTHECGADHWWDAKGRCVFCGAPKPLAIMRNVVQDTLDIIGHRA